MPKFSLIFLLILTNCTTTSTTEMEKKPIPVTIKAPKSMVCITLYNPVCGKNGKTYSNSCNADMAGVEYTQGACSLNK